MENWGRRYVFGDCFLGGEGGGYWVGGRIRCVGGYDAHEEEDAYVYSYYLAVLRRGEGEDWEICRLQRGTVLGG